MHQNKTISFSLNIFRVQNYPDKQLGLWMTKEDREMAEKLNELFVSVFSVESVEHVFRSQTLFSRREPEVTREYVIDLLGKIKNQ